MKLKNAHIEKMAQSDPVLQKAYFQFFQNPDADNAFFQENPNDELGVNYLIKDAFWLFLLEKYGYITR